MGARSARGAKAPAGLGASFSLHPATWRLRIERKSASGQLYHTLPTHFGVIPERAQLVSGTHEHDGVRVRRDALKIEIVPMRVVFLNQPNLPIAAPTLDPLLKGNGLGHLAVARIPDQPVDAVALREALDFARAMLSDPAFEAVGNAELERSMAPAGQNVDPVGH
jgi:hypothetical protein